MKYTKSDLAVNGGPKAKSTPGIPMFPGGMEIGEEEKKIRTDPKARITELLKKVFEKK